MDGVSRLIEEHYRATWGLMGGAVGGEIVDQPDRLYARAALDHIPYNHVMRCAPGDPAGADALIDEIFEALRDREAVWTISSECGPADLAERLVARGCEPYTTVTLMARELDEGFDRPPASEGVEIVEAGPDLLGRWIDLVLDQWHLSPADRATLVAMHEEFGYERVRRYLVLRDGETVAKASVAYHEPEVVGIYGVGTKPEARGMGLASALTVHALDQAVTLGARTAVLQSTPMAVGLYAGLGFVEYGTMPVFSKPAAVAPEPQPPVERMARL